MSKSKSQASDPGGSNVKQKDKFVVELSPIERYRLSENRDNPLIEKGFCNNVLYFWIDKVINAGEKKSFNFDDLYKPSDRLVYENTYPKFKEFMKAKLKKDPNSKIYYSVTEYIGWAYLNGAIITGLS